MAGGVSIAAHSITLTANARLVLERRYLQRNDAGALIETPEQLVTRVAAAIAGVESSAGLRDAWGQRFYDAMAGLRFLPNSPTLMNAGTGAGTLAACFVLPVEDSMESIMATAAAAAMVQKFGGGTGFSFSRLRGEGEPIASTHGRACGPLSVLRHYDDVSRLVTQGGKRDGANMGVLRVDHPDIEAFIHLKDDGATAQRFNISVAATDAFMAAARAGAGFTLTDPRDGAPRGELDASALLDEIARAAWATGDPGLIFIDAINRTNPTPALGQIESTNPCGEVPLLPWEACTLGSVNVARFWQPERGDLDWDALADIVRVGVRFLDNVIDASPFPVPEITEAVRGNRKIGLGIMGFADLLIAAGLPYDSEASLALAGRLARSIATAANEASLELGAEKGVFPNWEQSIFAGAGQRFRNATRTCIAPTGTISIIAGASSGIEPLFSLAHYRRMGDGTLLTETSAAFEAAARSGGFYSQALLSDIASGGRLTTHSDVPPDVARRFVTAHDVDWTWHVRMQAAFQAHTDLAVSKTINLPATASVAEVRAAYELAHELGCKGITVYRDGSHAGQVLSHAGPGEPATAGSGPVTLPAVLPAAPPEPHRRHLPDERPAVTHKFRVGEQEGYVTVGFFEDGSPGEVFIKIAKEGSTVSGLSDAVALLTSIALQYGVPLNTIAGKLEHTRFEPAGPTNNPDIPFATSILDYVYRWLRLHFTEPVDGTTDGATAASVASGVTCPDCGLQLEYVEACLVCRSCGYSTCS